jgi:hypothetical protein
MKTIILFLLIIATIPFSIAQDIKISDNEEDRKTQEFIINHQNLSKDIKIKILNFITIKDGIVVDIKDHTIITNLSKEVQIEIFKIFLRNDNFIIYDKFGGVYLKNENNLAYKTKPFTSGYKIDYVQTGGKYCKSDCQYSLGHWCWWTDPCE